MIEYTTISTLWTIARLILVCGLFWSGWNVILFTPPGKRWTMLWKIALLPLGYAVSFPLYDIIFHLAGENSFLLYLCSLPAMIGVWTLRSAAIDYHKNLAEAEISSLLDKLGLS